MQKEEFMGLTTFKGNQPTLKEAVVAKNYLSEKRIACNGTAGIGIFGFCRTPGRTRTGYDNEGLGRASGRILTMSGEQLLQGNEVYPTNRLLIKQRMNIKNIKHEHSARWKKIT